MGNFGKRSREVIHNIMIKHITGGNPYPFAHGFFSSLYYSYTQNVVFKFTTDDIYMEYLNRTQHLNNPFFPKVVMNFGVIGKTLSDDFNGKEDRVLEQPMYCVALEQLHLRTGFENDDAVVNAIAFYGISGLWNDHSDFDLFSVSSADFGEVVCDWYKIAETALKHGYDPLDLFEAISVIHNILEECECFDDMHGGNFMKVMGTGHIVISDPVGGRKSYNAAPFDRNINTLEDLKFIEDSIDYYKLDTIKSMGLV